MGRRIVLLRGINVGPHKRIPMAELRELFSGAQFDDVRTYVQSGNVVLASDAAPQELEQQSERLIAERFGLDVPVIVRTGEELAAAVEHDPLGDVADNPKLYQVSFMAAEPDDGLLERLSAVAAPGERLVARGREVYSWHPGGAARSKLWAKLAGSGLGMKATARNWTTVTKLLEMANG